MDKHTGKRRRLDDSSGKYSPITFEDSQNFIGFDFGSESESDSSVVSVKEPSFAQKRKYAEDLILSIHVLTPLAVPPWSDGEYSKDPVQFLNKEVVEFCNYIKPTKQEIAIRYLVQKNVTAIVRSIYPSAKVFAFGSFKTGIYLPSSDIDLVVIDKGAYFPVCLRRVAAALRKHDMVSEIEVIEKSKVPIVKFTDKYSKFKVDLSFNIDGGLESAAIVERFIKDPTIGTAVESLMLIFKQFLVQRHLNEVYTGGLGSYALLIMIVGFLKLHPMIQTNQLDIKENLGVLMIEFLEFYGKALNYSSVGVGVSADGGAFLFNKKQAGFYIYDRPSALSLRDPQDPSNDISRGSFAIHVVRNEFSRAFTRITAMIGIYVNEEKRTNLNTILGSIISISKKVMEHRSSTLEMYNELVESSIDVYKLGVTGSINDECVHEVFQSKNPVKFIHDFQVDDSGSDY